MVTSIQTRPGRSHTVLFFPCHFHLVFFSQFHPTFIMAMCAGPFPIASEWQFNVAWAPIVGTDSKHRSFSFSRLSKRLNLPSFYSI